MILNDLWNIHHQKRNFDSLCDPQNKWFIFIEDIWPFKKLKIMINISKVSKDLKVETSQVFCIACFMLFTHAIYAWRLEHLRNVVLLILWWSIPNNFGLLGLDPQFICTLGWAFPTMGDPRCGYWCHFWSSSVTLTPNHLDLSLAKKAAKQPSLLPKIWIGFPSLRDVFFLNTYMHWNLIG